MSIKFNEVTWYSKLSAVIFFVATLIGAFYFGVQWGKLQTTLDVSVQKNSIGSSVDSTDLNFSMEECNTSGCGFKTLKEATSGFQMQVPVGWGEINVVNKANAGDKKYIDSQEQHKTYADPLYLSSWLVPKAEVTFSNITSRDVYNPKLYFFDKSKFQYSFEMANFVSEMKDKSDTVLMARNRDDFFRANGCGSATMFWHFGYCDNKFITPMLLSSDPIILGFEQGTLATEYGYAYLVDGKNYWVLISFESNSASDFFKKFIEEQSISPKADYVNIISAKKSDVQVTEDYPSTMLRFLKVNDDDKFATLKEIEAIIDSVEVY